MTRVLTDTELQALVDSVHAGAGSELATIDFCAIWPTAKAVLQVLGKVPALGLICSILVAIGDAYSAKHCKKATK